MYGLKFVRAYLDDLLVVSKDSIENYFIHLEEAFTRLANAGLKVNMSKSHFCYLINRKGVRPNMGKVVAMMKIDTPKTRKQLRSFIVVVNYHMDM
jgi:hypothetical protein